MKPASFDYYAPTTIAEALDVLAEVGYGGKVLAGGQSLVPAMNFRMALPSALIDLNNIPELSYIKPASDGGVLIGAMTRDSQVEFNALVAKAAPMVKETMPHVAHPQIRNRGTFGGLHAHADPTAQIPAVTWALGAKMLVRSKDGEHWVDASEFYWGPFTPAIEPNELLVEVALPPMPKNSGSSFKQVARQHGAQGLVGAAAFVELDEQGRCKVARLILTSVGETVLLAASASQMLVGEMPSAELIAAAADAAATTDIDPGSDIHCTAEFRRHLTRVLSRQSLTQAFERAAGRES